MKFAIVFAAILCLFFSSPVEAKDKVLRISTSYRNLLSNSDCSGMLDQIVTEAFRRIGIKVEIVFTTTKRSVVEVNDGLLDGELNRIEGMEQGFNNLVRVPEPNMQMHFVAFAKRDIPISDWESLKDLRIGLVSGWKILEQNIKGFPNVTYLTEIATLFKMLEMDRLDVVLYSQLTGYEELHKLGYDDIHHLTPPLCVNDMFLYLHKSHKEIVVPVAEALREMKKDGTYDKIIQE
ncbi:MAG: transporter substrate-binding domain-containing protein, partial [Proteobacteria bacterium]|nr:transporter substrate-binding domain-containing protein [Pseudomonadota bacterium]